MTSVLVTAFKPYDRWPTNSSWLTMVELTKNLPDDIELTTRLYPVDYDEVRLQLKNDLVNNFDYALHLGQSPGASRVTLESIGINVGEKGGKSFALVKDGPVAYRSELPLEAWAARLRENGIPASISFHAGAYLCNATLYLCHDLIRSQNLKTKAAFVHLPLDVTQIVRMDGHWASLPTAISAAAVRRLLEEITSHCRTGT